MLHGKRIPWFVSDVTVRDLEYLVSGFVDGSIYPDMADEDEQVLREAGKVRYNLIVDLKTPHFPISKRFSSPSSPPTAGPTLAILSAESHLICHPTPNIILCQAIISCTKAKITTPALSIPPLHLHHHVHRRSLLDNRSPLRPPQYRSS